eukprot:144132-Rhodomonas_salina.3
MCNHAPPSLFTLTDLDQRDEDDGEVEDEEEVREERIVGTRPRGLLDPTERCISPTAPRKDAQLVGQAMQFTWKPAVINMIPKNMLSACVTSA